jgi:hypothetical protein
MRALPSGNIERFIRVCNCPAELYTRACLITKRAVCKPLSNQYAAGFLPVGINAALLCFSQTLLLPYQREHPLFRTTTPQ